MRGWIGSAAAGAFATIVVAASAAAALEEVTFATNWVAEAEHGGYYQALVDGTYEECGLDVTIIQGGPQLNNRIKLATGQVDFYMGGSLLLGYNAVRQGIPTLVVAAHFQKDPQVVMTHPDQGLDTWADLKDIDLLLGDEVYHGVFQWMKSEFGFRDEQRRPYTFNTAPFLADKRVGQQGYISSEPFAVIREGGFEPNIFLFADYGYDSYSTTVETTHAMVEQKPEVVQCFVDASAIGWYNYLYGDNAAANELIKAENPEMTDAQIEFSVAALKKYGIVDSGDALTLGVGAMTAERHKSFFDKMVKAGVVEADFDHTRSYTLDFVNKGVGLDVKKTLQGM